MSDAERTPATTAATGMTTRDKARAALWGLLIVLLVVFAVLNTTSVEVDWIFGTFSTPLILLIAVCLIAGFALGAGAAHVVERRRRRAKRT